MFFDFAEKVHRFGEEMEGVHHHNLGLAGLEISHSMQQVGNHDIPRNQGVGEYGIPIILHCNLESEHGLFFEVFETHLFGFGDVGFLVEDLVGGEGGGGGDCAGGGEGAGGGGGGEGRDGGEAEAEGEGGGVGFHGCCCCCF